ncbi:hypothetical protein M514_11614 [Trichuris suis]|uniref:Uncharacterized protein n=1 Tax=Trichuris suis TaxID=68888 RepID=A0A085NS94_9BILA|nr:hypothetical protein M514_11614 [Trichuris suis]
MVRSRITVNLDIDKAVLNMTDVIWDLAPVKTIYATKVFGITFHSVKGKSTTPKNCVMPWNRVQLDFCYDRKKIIHIRFPKLETVNLWMSVFAGGTKKVPPQRRISRQGARCKPIIASPSDQSQFLTTKEKPLNRSALPLALSEATSVISKPERKDKIRINRAYFKTYTVKKRWQYGDFESIELNDTNGGATEQTAFQTREEEDKFVGEKLQQCADTQRTGLVRDTLSPHKLKEASTNVPTTATNTLMTEVTTIQGCGKETTPADSSLERDLAALCSIESTGNIGKVGTSVNVEQASQTRQAEQTTLESQPTLTTTCYDGLNVVESERSFRNGEIFFVKANDTTSQPAIHSCNTMNEEQKCDCRPCHSEPCAIAHPPFAKLRDRVGTLLFQHGCYASAPSTPIRK